MHVCPFNNITCNATVCGHFTQLHILYIINRNGISYNTMLHINLLHRNNIIDMQISSMVMATVQTMCMKRYCDIYVVFTCKTVTQRRYIYDLSLNHAIV
jgi:hypothetical protein